MDTELITRMWLNGDKAEVICIAANCKLHQLRWVIKSNGLPGRDRSTITELTRKILEYPRSTPYAVIQQALGCTASQIHGARSWHLTPRTKPVRSETMTDDDKRLAAALFGQLSFAEIATKLECTRSAVKQYAATLGVYANKADHLRALIAAGHSREHCLAMSGAARNEYRRIAAELCVKRPPVIKPGDKYQHWTVIAADAGNTGSRVKWYQCQCVCGTLRVLRHDVLRGLRSASCGCMRRRGAVAIDLVQRKERIAPDSCRTTGALTNVKRAYEHYTATGCNITQACEYAGISSATWYRYIHAVSGVKRNTGPSRSAKALELIKHRVPPKEIVAATGLKYSTVVALATQYRAKTAAQERRP